VRIAFFATPGLTIRSATPILVADTRTMADRLVNDPPVEARNPHGLRLPPTVRADQGVQFGKALRVPLKGRADFWRIGVTAPVLKAIRKGDQINGAFWAHAEDTGNGAPGEIGRVRLEATPVVRASSTSRSR
jgi:hypothetical protein